MSTIAVTGAEGLVGRDLVERLRQRPDVSRVLALDIEVPAHVRSGVDARVVDVRDPGLAQVLAGCDALVHLAFVVEPRKDEAAMRDVNVLGTQNILRCAQEAGIGRVVVLSSAMAYGALPDNDLPLTEASPLRGTDDLPHVGHKVEVERWMANWAAEPSRPSLAVLRPSLITGPGANDVLTRLLETPPFLMVRGHRPPIQFTHVEDVTSAIELLLDQPTLTGAFNCASEGWLSSDEFLAISDVRHVELPLEVAHQLAHRAWQVGLSPFHPGLLPFAMHPWVVSVQRLVDAGWHPKHSNRDALAEMVKEHREYISLGPVRARRKDLAKGALVTGAAGLGLVALRRLRSRR